MNWQIILTSTVCAAIISGLFNLYFKRRDYANDYYKYILDKRKKAYELLETFIPEFSSCIVLLFNNKFNKSEVFFQPIKKEYPLTELILKLVEVYKNGFWYSPEMSICIVEANDFLQWHTHLEEKIKSKVDTYTIDSAQELYLKSDKIYQKIIKQFFYDLNQLNNIPKFQKSKINVLSNYSKI